MSTLIVYASTHGFTEMCARRIADELPGTVDLADLSTHPHPDLPRAETILIGGSIHVGSIQPAVALFCDHHRDTLLQHPLGLFMTCMKRDEEAADEFDHAFPLRLRAHAFATAILGGAFYLDRMSLLQRWVVRQIAKVTESVEDLDADAFATFVDRVASQIKQPRLASLRPRDPYLN